MGYKEDIMKIIVAEKTVHNGTIGKVILQPSYHYIERIIVECYTIYGD
jgi:hypothetical protein